MSNLLIVRVVLRACFVFILVTLITILNSGCTQSNLVQSPESELTDDLSFFVTTSTSGDKIIDILPFSSEETRPLFFSGKERLFFVRTPCSPRYIDLPDFDARPEMPRTANGLLSSLPEPSKIYEYGIDGDWDNSKVPLAISEMGVEPTGCPPLKVDDVGKLTAEGTPTVLIIDGDNTILFADSTTSNLEIRLKTQHQEQDLGDIIDGEIQPFIGLNGKNDGGRIAVVAVRQDAFRFEVYRADEVRHGWSEPLVTFDSVCEIDEFCEGAVAEIAYDTFLLYERTRISVKRPGHPAVYYHPEIESFEDIPYSEALHPIDNGKLLVVSDSNNLFFVGFDGESISAEPEKMNLDVNPEEITRTRLWKFRLSQAGLVAATGDGVFIRTEPGVWRKRANGPYQFILAGNGRAAAVMASHTRSIFTNAACPSARQKFDGLRLVAQTNTATASYVVGREINSPTEYRILAVQFLHDGEFSRCWDAGAVQ